MFKNLFNKNKNKVFYAFADGVSFNHGLNMKAKEGILLEYN